MMSVVIKSEPTIIEDGCGPAICKTARYGVSRMQQSETQFRSQRRRRHARPPWLFAMENGWYRLIDAAGSEAANPNSVKPSTTPCCD